MDGTTLLASVAGSVDEDRLLRAGEGVVVG
jgi:hypothetical protein